MFKNNYEKNKITLLQTVPNYMLLFVIEIQFYFKIQEYFMKVYRVIC